MESTFSNKNCRESTAVCRRVSFVSVKSAIIWSYLITRIFHPPKLTDAKAFRAFLCSLRASSCPERSRISSWWQWYGPIAPRGPLPHYQPGSGTSSEDRGGTQMIRVVFGKACGFYPQKSQEGRVIDGFQVFIRHSTRLIRVGPACLDVLPLGFSPNNCLGNFIPNIFLGLELTHHPYL